MIFEGFLTQGAVLTWQISGSENVERSQGVAMGVIQ